MSLFKRIKESFRKKDDQAIYLNGFKKTNSVFSNNLKKISSIYKEINDEFLEELMIVLLESDVGIHTADKICSQLRKRGNEYYAIPSFATVMDFLMEIMKEIYEEEKVEKLEFSKEGPCVILLVGVNGSGKTTTCAKLVEYFKTHGKSVAVVAADTFRAGAVDQLAKWADTLNVHCIKGKENSDPSSVLVDGCRYAKENNIDILLCDTAGRLQNKQNLMNELSKMHKVVGKEIENAPNHVWLVVDATTGQNGLSQAEIFKEVTNVSGIILTKMDGTAKGGVVLAIKDNLKIPVYFIGLGEKPEDLRPFDIDSYLYSITRGIRDDE
ncbi:MAG: signal recognition particle-docking protein FtsY [Anaerorhabdus sp.]